MPSLLSTEEMIDMFLVDHQGFYEIRDRFTVNFLAHLAGQGRNRYRRQLIFKNISLLGFDRGSDRLTADALTAIFLRKMHEGLDDR